VEDFWCLINALKAPSQLSMGANYHVFKEGIQPEVREQRRNEGRRHWRK